MDSGSYRINVERTLAIIKPDAIHNLKEIEDVLLKSGFIILQRRLQLSPEQCSDFYADQNGKPIFPSLMDFMSSGPIVALMLARDDAVAHWKSIIGPASITEAKENYPECLRAKYGSSDLHNALHGSESLHAAVREIRFMFPDTIIEGGEATEEYLSKNVNPILLRGLTELCKEKPLNPRIWLSDWLMKNNPYQPQICDGVMDEN
ncbi:nucleoside diphosphate kinase homolog 5 isoform X2 [Austrofundulus limnaeus]|uniref:Nucleoside diphosphate kinase B n=1 Tax=Austrofundulus limnaeus TaxID=52670 RepID=A0A2I4D5M8_AUSLI|nr:PREDICTED: nucleoside diphosphate kinase homolog 5-like isoform X2 [Austrofundulus limnaeus]